MSAAASSRPTIRNAILVIGLATALAAAGAAAFVAPQQTKADHIPVHGTILARAPFGDPTDVKVKGFVGGMHTVSNAPDAADTIVQQVVVKPGGFTGWHTHPGPAIVIVKEGTFTYYPGDDPACTGFAYGPGEAFIDPGQGHVHSAWNHGSVDVVTYVTYFDVPSEVVSPFVPAVNPGNCEF
jgi:quercetin dioxygenase-like cupin family protein